MRSPSIAIREASWLAVERMGLARNAHLPVLVQSSIQVSNQEAVGRLLCFHAVGAASFGFPREEALDWLASLGLQDEIRPSEKAYLDGDDAGLLAARMGIYSAYALAWALRIVDELRVAADLPADFASRLPNLADKQFKGFGSPLTLRMEAEIVETIDHLYCLQWALRDADLRMTKSPHIKWLLPVRAERHSLEWLISGSGWDDISLDT
jgi:hypothetical protein